MSARSAASNDPSGSVHSKDGQRGDKHTVELAESFAGGVAAKVSAVIAANDGGLMQQIETLKKAQTEARKARQQITRGFVMPSGGNAASRPRPACGATTTWWQLF